MGIKLSELPPAMRKQAEEQLAVGRRVPSPATKPECDPHETLEKHPQAALISERVYLVVLMYRCGGIEWDLDNASFKPVLDGLVQAGVLEDDSCSFIEGLIKLPRKVKTKDEERTELEFWSAEHFSKHIDAARQERCNG